MNASFKIRPPPKGFALQLAIVVILVALLLGGVYVGSFVSHFVWAVVTKPSSAEEAPAWLVLPSFFIAFVLFIVAARWLRLIDRLLKACDKK